VRYFRTATNLGLLDVRCGLGRKMLRCGLTRSIGLSRRTTTLLRCSPATQHSPLPSKESSKVIPQESFHYFSSTSNQDDGDDNDFGGRSRRGAATASRRRPSFLADDSSASGSKPAFQTLDELFARRHAELKQKNKNHKASRKHGNGEESGKNYRVKIQNGQNRKKFDGKYSPGASQSNQNPSQLLKALNRRRNETKSFDRTGSQSTSKSSPEEPSLTDIVNEWRKATPQNRPLTGTSSGMNPSERRPIRRQEQPRWRQLRQQQNEFLSRKRHQNQSNGDSGQQQNDFLFRKRHQNQSNESSSGFSETRSTQSQSVENKNFLMGRLDQHQSRPSPGSHIKQDRSEREVILPAIDIGLTALSSLFRIKVDSIKEKLSSLGETVTDDMLVDVDTMELLAMEFGLNTVRSSRKDVVDDDKILLQRRAGVEEHDVEQTATSPATQPPEVNLPPRPPVVCIMGHVDHGKTTLMDALRRKSAEQKQGGKGKKKKKGTSKSKESTTSNIAGTEAGGITQIISAFQVDVPGHDGSITFLDTPGHAAFKSMRQSGSHAADVVVLVIAADDGVSPQTVEIINFYKSIIDGAGGNGISMVVALNKIDKPGIDVDEAKMRIENQLLEHGIVTEGMKYSGSEYGPPVQVIPTSGLTGAGLDDLMEGLLLQSEVMDLRADDQANAEGIVMDARIEKGLGAVVDCIIRWGKIQKGDVVVSGTQFGRVRMLKDVDNGMLKQGLPSQPVRIVGFKALPKAGDPIICLESEEAAEELVRLRTIAEEQNGDTERVDYANDVEVQIPGMRSQNSRRAQRVFEKAGIEDDNDTIRIPVVIKADADGSLSAVRESLVAIGENSKAFKIKIDPVAEGIGAVTATDIQMANESNAVIFAFGLKRIDQNTLNMAEAQEVSIHSNAIIYSLLDEAKEVFSQYLPKVPTEHIHGSASIQAIFEIDGDDGPEKVAGMKVLEGHIYKEKAQIDSGKIPCSFRVIRDGERVSPSGETVRASSLRKFKELVESVRRGEECGLALKGFADFREGDVIECYSIEMKSPTLS
jgi:translation initiation factor IF-2